jgi:hypothetical protein
LCRIILIMNTNPQPSCSALNHGVQAVLSVTVGRFAKVKALEPLTSTSAPSPAQIIEYSKNRAMLRVGRYMTVGTIVQLHLEGEFLLWKVFCCIPKGNSYYLGIELVEAFPNR